MKKPASTKLTRRKPTTAAKATTKATKATKATQATKATTTTAAKRAAKPTATKPAATRGAKPAPTRVAIAHAATARTARTAPARQIDAKLAALGDWRGELLGRLRALIHEADHDVVEEVKWGGVPVWSHAGIITTGETYKAVVKLTFANGASLPDPAKLFNSSLAGNTRRAIDFPHGATIDEAAFKALVRDAVAHNVAKRAR